MVTRDNIFLFGLKKVVSLQCGIPSWLASIMMTILMITFATNSIADQEIVHNNDNETVFFNTILLYDSGNAPTSISSMQKKQLEQGYQDYYQKAVDGDPVAQYYIAIAQFFGVGTGYHDSMSITSWMKKSADQNYIPAITYLGQIYLHGYQYLSSGTPPPVEQLKSSQKNGLKLIEYAAKKQDPYALYLLGTFYYNGTLINKDFKKSFGLFKDSADKNFPTGQVALGDMYYYGYGTAQNYKQAFQLYSKALKNKNISLLSARYAQYQLGNIYYNGYAVNKNTALGIQYYTKAANNKYIPAVKVLISIYYKDKTLTGKNKYKYWTCFIKAVNLYSDPSKCNRE